ncbi:hypothetical protein [Pseudoclavibacter helvolus]|uniref:hypothetical protein n=1 Tax=Pseudoclavibacter helvolus TaxID=255205 RepID=UPI003C766A64
MVKRTDLAWGELRTDSGVLIHAGVIDPHTHDFGDGCTPALDRVALVLTVKYPYRDNVVSER